MPPTRRPAVASARVLFRNDVLKARPGENRKNSVVEAEKPEERGRIRGHARADTADADGDRERQEEERQQQLASAARGRHRGEQGADGGDADVRERAGRVSRERSSRRRSLRASAATSAA